MLPHSDFPDGPGHRSQRSELEKVVSVHPCPPFDRREERGSRPDTRIPGVKKLA